VAATTHRLGLYLHRAVAVGCDGGAFGTFHRATMTTTTALARCALALDRRAASGRRGISCNRTRRLRRGRRGGLPAFHTRLALTTRLAIGTALAAAACAGLAVTTTTTRLISGLLLARFAEDRAHALAGLFVHFVTFHRCTCGTRQRGQQFRGYRLHRDLLLDVSLDVRQAHRVAFAGEADRISFFA